MVNQYYKNITKDYIYSDLSEYNHFIISQGDVNHCKLKKSLRLYGSPKESKKFTITRK